MTGHLVTQIMRFGDRCVYVQSKVVRKWHWLDIRIQLTAGKKAEAAAGEGRKVFMHQVQNFLYNGLKKSRAPSRRGD